MVLIIGFVWPEPRSSAAGSRMVQLIQYFQSRNYNITFASSSARSEKAYDLSSLGVDEVPIALNHSSFDSFIKNLNPAIVLFDRFMTEEQFGWRVAEQCPDALRILDTEDLHGVRKGREQAIRAQQPFDSTLLFNDIAKREIASIYRSDLSLIISEAEMDILKHQFKVDERLLLYLPFMLDPIAEETLQKIPAFGRRRHFMAIGNFRHAPNTDAVLYLRESIWPLIRRLLPHSELHVYGAYASQKATEWHNNREGFLIKGFALDVNKVMAKAKVCLAPLRFGAGLKGKLIDAMQNGTPCMMSGIAAEGMFGELEPNGCIEDYPKDFALKAVELYTNEALWKEKQNLGFQILGNRFDKAFFYGILDLTIQTSIQQLNARRLDNFTGQMLWHQSLQSSKYMGKWIEEKNKQTSNHEP